MALSFSPTGQALTKRFESLKLMPYLDRSGPQAVWTVGWGHTGPDVIPGRAWTIQQAQTAFLADTAAATAAVNAKVRVPINQNQFDALVDFAFNVGIGAFGGSTLLTLLNAKNYAGAADCILNWNKMRIAGVITVSNGLTRRRTAEKELFLSPPKVAILPK